MEDEALKELCASNGLSVGRLEQEGPQVKNIEMFFSGYPVLCGLHHFPNLTYLCVMGQTVEKVQGLHTLSRLRELWIAECQIKRIDGLSHNRMLKKLYLYGNLIERIDNLDHLSELEVLYLDSNKITNIEGLQTLLKLKELNLAANNICKIGHGLNCLLRLEILNISGNMISSFKDITHLVRLPQLKNLGLKDPMYYPNPVCLLCNYTTHVLYHLPTLRKLDSYDVATKSIQDTVETTVIKKKMFYNMRAKAINRQQSYVISKLTSLKDDVYLRQPREKLAVLMAAIKEIDHTLSETGLAHPGSEENDSKMAAEDLDEEDKATVKDFETKRDSLKQRVVHWADKKEKSTDCDSA